MDNHIDLRKNKHHPVEKGCWTAIRIRFETLFTEYGKTRGDLTHFLGCDKAKTSRIVNGLEIPNLPTRVKIACFFTNENGKPIDTSVIWENPEINKEEKNEK